jgi:hypothetical protein
MRRSLPRALVLLAALAASGCVSAMTARNYVPQTAGVDAAYYECLRDAQQDYARARYGAYANGYSYAASGSSAAGVTTNVGMLKSCMGAKGYRKRDATSTETWVGVTTAPVWLPLCLVAATSGVDCLADE